MSPLSLAPHPLLSFELLLIKNRMRVREYLFPRLATEKYEKKKICETHAKKKGKTDQQKKPGGETAIATENQKRKNTDEHNNELNFTPTFIDSEQANNIERESKKKKSEDLTRKTKTT